MLSRKPFSLTKQFMLSSDLKRNENIFMGTRHSSSDFLEKSALPHHLTIQSMV